MISYKNTATGEKKEKKLKMIKAYHRKPNRTNLEEVVLSGTKYGPCESIITTPMLYYDTFSPTHTVYSSLEVN